MDLDITLSCLGSHFFTLEFFKGIIGKCCCTCKFSTDLDEPELKGSAARAFATCTHSRDVNEDSGLN